MDDSNRQMEMIKAMAEISGRSARLVKSSGRLRTLHSDQYTGLKRLAAVEAASGQGRQEKVLLLWQMKCNLPSNQQRLPKHSDLMKGTIEAVREGTRMADETAQTLTEVVEGPDRCEVVDGISQASDEQASSIALVTQEMGQISDVVQTNSATAEESAATSEELFAQAQILKNLVNQFRLK